MGNKWKKGPNGVKVLNVPGQINPIAREPVDNTTDLERAVFKAQTKRKFPAPDASTPGRKVTAPPRSEGPLPS